jgi:cell division protein FtsI/penicillin-binding protein 2
VASHVIGYVGRIDENELRRLDPGQYSGSTHIGKIGVESSYEDVLRGRTGWQQVETNAEGRPLRVLSRTPPTPGGKNIYLSIDIRLQAVAEKVLEGYNGAIVALDPRNGEVLALASQPLYDPNPFRQRHRRGVLPQAQHLEGQTTAQSRPAWHVSAGFNHQAANGAGGTRLRGGQPLQRRLLSRFLPAARQQPQVPRLETRRPRQRRAWIGRLPSPAMCTFTIWR